MSADRVNENIRYEPEDHPPHPIVIGTGFQATAIILAPVAITVVIVARIAEQPESYITWAVFATLLTCGITTILQAVRIGRVGAGHVLLMGTAPAFIAVCIAALVEGGPATMASLIIVSSLFQFLLASRLSLLRRIFTPVVTGTVIMLASATVIPIMMFGSLNDVPEGSPDAAAPIAALVTLAVVVGLVLRGPPQLQLWSPLIGIVAGCAVSAILGIYDAQEVLAAPWVGVPISSWPGLGLTPGPEFWALLPAFIMVTVVGALKNIGDGVAIQGVSRRRPRATDFRVVQGSLNADGIGKLLCGVAGTMPNTTYSTSISLADVTGVAARRVGIAIGVIFIIVAFFPKIAALLIDIPGPVAAAYVTLLMALLFVQGMKIIIDDGLDQRKAAVAGLSFWIGVGFENQWILPELLGDGFVGILLGNGMTAGPLAAIVMMVFLELTGSRRRRLSVALDSESLPEIDTFLRRFASRAGWDAAATDRLASAGEETLAVLLQEDDDAGSGRRLAVTARMDGRRAELEFVTALEGENVEDYLANLSSLPPAPNEREVSFRLLLHYASSVRHQKYHGVDIVTVSVEGAA